MKETNSGNENRMLKTDDGSVLSVSEETAE